MTGTSTPSNIDDKVIPNDPDGLQKFLNDNDINLQWLLDHDQEASVCDETPADNSCEQQLLTSHNGPEERSLASLHPLVIKHTLQTKTRVFTY